MCDLLFPYLQQRASLITGKGLRQSGIKAAGKVNEAYELVDFTPAVEETKEADAATETAVEAAE